MVDTLVDMCMEDKFVGGNLSALDGVVASSGYEDFSRFA